MAEETISIKRFEAEATANRVLEALGPERVEKGLHAYGAYAFCCRSWQSCFLAQALEIHEDVARDNPAKLLKIAEQIDVKPSDIKSFISIFDNDSRLVPTTRLKELCFVYLERAKQEAKKVIKNVRKQLIPVPASGVQIAEKEAVLATGAKRSRSKK